jgi:hypothetical protein
LRGGWRGLAGNCARDDFVGGCSAVRSADWAFHRSGHAPVNRLDIERIFLSAVADNFHRNHRSDPLVDCLLPKLLRRRMQPNDSVASVNHTLIGNYFSCTAARESSANQCTPRVSGAIESAISRLPQRQARNCNDNTPLLLVGFEERPIQWRRVLLKLSDLLAQQSAILGDMQSRI